MNERIKELGHEALIWCDANISDQWDADTGYGQAWQDKLAELIVKECLDELAMCQFDNPSAAWMEERNDGIDFCITVIKEHFGVE